MTDLKKPTAPQIDRLVKKLEKYQEASKPTAKQRLAAELAADVRAHLLSLAMTFGEVPKAAPASKRLLGSEFQLTATSGTTTTEHPAVVLELRDAMRLNKQDALFSQLFTPSTRYDRAKDAANNLKNAVLPEKLRKLFDGIFERTFSQGTRAPILRIDPIK